MELNFENKILMYSTIDKLNNPEVNEMHFAWEEKRLLIEDNLSKISKYTSRIDWINSDKEISPLSDIGYVDLFRSTTIHWYDLIIETYVIDIHIRRL